MRLSPASFRSSRRLLFTVAGVVGPDLPHGELSPLQFHATVPPSPLHVKGGALNYSIVASRSTLEALTRWWNDLGEDFHFGSGRGKHFDTLLTEAVKKRH